MTFIDMFERKRSEEPYARLAAIVRNSDDASIGLTPEGSITTWSAGAERTRQTGERRAIEQDIATGSPAAPTFPLHRWRLPDGPGRSP